jgi:hypothetical protein
VPNCLMTCALSRCRKQVAASVHQGQALTLARIRHEQGLGLRAQVKSQWVEVSREWRWVVRPSNQ